jgi:uncharacterized protein (DUF362 family)
MNDNRTITILYGESELKKMTLELLDTVGMHERITAGARIALKPNLVVADSPERGAVTHPEIAEGVIIHLQEHGHRNISILEGSWVGDSTRRAFKAAGYRRLEQQYGILLIDTQKCSSHAIHQDGYELNVCDIMDEFDILINLPVLKGHCQTRYTGALKNLKGCIPDSEKRRFHSLGLHEPIARLNTVIRQDFIIMDGICGDPTFEEGGSPSRLHRLLYCEDPVLIDSYAASILGWEPADIPYITRSAELGVGHLRNEETVIREINEEARGAQRIATDPLIDELASYIDQRQACSSCYAALIQAFRDRPELRRQVSIGRAFRSCSPSGSHSFGIGSCTQGFPDHVPGCPPSPGQIIRALKTRS